MGKINSRQKGARGEREVAHKLQEVLGIECRRGQQFSGLEGDDVVGWDGVHIESKFVEALNLQKAMEQSERDAGTDEVPVVIHKKNRKDMLITVRVDDLIRFSDALDDALCRRKGVVRVVEWSKSGSRTEEKV